MHGILPIARHVPAVACQSPSRIPHLSFHILQRQAKIVNLRPIHVSSVIRQQRRHSTSIDNTGFKSFGFHVPEGESVTNGFTEYGKNKSHAYAKNAALPAVVQTESGDEINFYRILEQDSPELTFLALCSETIGTPFVRDAPDDLFDTALLSLDPDHFITTQRRLYRYLRNADDAGYGSRGIKYIEDRFELYTNLLRRIIGLRHDGKHKLTLESCTHILRWAAALGDEAFARQVFDEEMPADGIEPDVDCYSYYMEALNWSNAHSDAEKFHMRVLPVHTAIRRQFIRPAAFSGYRTDNHWQEIKGVKGEILDIFKGLIETGEKAHGGTFINMMVAMGREGDIEGVLSVLKSVWNIDLGSLEMYGEDEIEAPTYYDEKHPLRPTGELLFALAHIFGSNNDIRTAWTLVDYVSRSYAISIPHHVWTELLEWCMVLSIKRGKTARKNAYATGQTSPEEFEKLFATMTDEPHNIQPDGAAYYIQSRVRFDKKVLDEQVECIDGLQSQVDGSIVRLRESMRNLSLHIQQLHEQKVIHLWTQTEFFRLRRDFLTKSLEVDTNIGMMRHAVLKRIFQRRHWAETGKRTGFERRRVPQLFERYKRYMPTTFEYKTSGGDVVLWDTDQKSRALRELHGITYHLMTKLRMALDTQDHDALLEAVLDFKPHKQ